MTDEQVAAIRAHVSKYAGADDRKAWASLAATLLAQAGVIVLYLMGWGFPAFLLGAGVAIRGFIIYHDCVHRSYFKKREWNDRLATVLQLWLLTPLKLWRDNHLAHHRKFGDLGFKDIADTILFTKEQFDAMPWWKRSLVRLGRNPFVFFTVLPIVQWFFEYPILAGNPWIWSGLALLVIVALKVSVWHVVAMYVGMIGGLMLFHLQHGINRSYRVPTEQWSFERAALMGSTWVPVPWPLSWFTFGIEFHHVHHLHPGVPAYSLAACHREAPAGMWGEVTVGTWRKCLEGLRNVMWDQERGELVPF